MIKLIQFLKEVFTDKIYETHGTLMADTTKRGLADILSDIRSIEGITVVRVTNNRQPSAEKLKNYTVDISVKIDPSPFESFGIEKVKFIQQSIRDIPAVRKAVFKDHIKIVKK